MNSSFSFTTPSDDTRHEPPPSHSPQAHRRHLQRSHSAHPTPTTSLLSPPNTVPHHYSPRRHSNKRQSTDSSLLGSPEDPARRIRRRLFFGDNSSNPLDKPRQAEALAVIREAVEIGEPHIDLSDLQLTQVPDELAELQHLVSLTPAHSLVSDIQLTLGSNCLRNFPLAICELTNLTMLILSNNRITHLPPEIANLRNLRELSVANNCLRELPIELTQLEQLEILAVFPNPFASQKEENKRLVEWRQSGIPRLSDLVTRAMTPEHLRDLKHTLTARCSASHLPLGRIVGQAVQLTDNGLLEALRTQHLAVPLGHRCWNCQNWFLVPAVETVEWKTLPPVLTRICPFRIRYCSRNCFPP